MRGSPESGAIMDIVVWLRGLGLAKYEVLFRENDIDETVLLTLTAEDLKELGVTSFGHRRKLLDAIAALRGDTTAQVPSDDLKTSVDSRVAKCCLIRCPVEDKPRSPAGL